MVTDLVQIRRLGEQKQAENEKLRQHLKRRNFVEKRLLRIASDIADQIDCRACANCCKVATARVTERDIEKLARYLRISPAQFVRDYTVESEDEGALILARSEQGCVFLEGGECSVYDARPASCRDFPHLVSNHGSLTSRMWEMKDRATYCPIVYNSLEAFKEEVGFGR